MSCNNERVRVMEVSPKILIVEDQKADAFLMEKKVSELLSGSTFLSVQTIEEASQALKADRFDMIMLDLNLPDGFGAQTVKDVRKCNTATPIIVTTGMVSESTVRLGANNVVSKASITGEDFGNILEQNLAS